MPRTGQSRPHGMRATRAVTPVCQLPARSLRLSPAERILGQRKCL